MWLFTAPPYRGGMTTSTSAAPPAPPRRLLLTLVHLAAVGVLGSAAFSILIGFFTAGVSTIVVLGIGILLLLGVVYALYAVGWFEVQRLNSLYGFGLSPLRFRGHDRPGFGGYLRSMWRQAIDGGMWRAVANMGIATLLGLAIVRLLGFAVSALFWSFTPLTGAAPQRLFGLEFSGGWITVVGIAGILFAGLAIYGLATLHWALSQAIVADPHRRDELLAQAEVSDQQRAGAVRAADVERTRIERDLHDGVQPRLVSVGMTLGLAQQKIDDDPAAAKELIAEAHTSTKSAITELRQLARGIHASVLDDRGLDAALSALAGRSHIPVSLDVRMEGLAGRSRDAEAAVYFAIAESLTNAAKHSRASECRVIVRGRADNTIWARVEDNGIGGAQVQPGGGLDGIMNRILAAGGTARLDSPVGGPTSLEVSVPCAS